MSKDDKRADGEGADDAKGPDPVKIKRHADGIREAYEKGTEISDAGRPKFLVLGLASLIDAGELEAAAYAMPRLIDKFPHIDYLKTLAPVLAALPPPVDDPTFAGFVDDPQASVQMVRREGASTLLLGFGGLSGKMMIPLTLMNRILGPANVHVVYIRMEAWAPIRNGPTLGNGLDKVVEGISKIVKDFSPTRLVSQGHSGGGLGALITSVPLGVDSVLCFGAPTSAEHSKPLLRMATRLGRKPTWTFRDDYEVAEKPPLVRMVYGAESEVDRQHAEVMQGLPNVEVEGVPGVTEHECFTPVFLSGRYDALLRELVEGVPAGSADKEEVIASAPARRTGKAK